jgi:hypothetical protein
MLDGNFKGAVISAKRPGCRARPFAGASDQKSDISKIAAN